MRRSGIKRGQRLRRQSRRRMRLQANYVAFTLGIKDRDGWRCRVCFGFGILDVHHVIKRSQGGGLMDPHNAVTLCRQCHDRTDAPYTQGRLVIKWAPPDRFFYDVVYAPSKFAVKKFGGG